MPVVVEAISSGGSIRPKTINVNHSSMVVVAEMTIGLRLLLNANTPVVPVTR